VTAALSSSPVACTHDSHRALKADKARWLAETTPVGEMVSDGETLELATHTCGSTLARLVVDEEDDAP
jgi:hypothetical protein